ncbi:MAG TPA: amidase family protein [Gaiellaceae bacterium]|nr:amidase family protein [Gaiellaceae bacterium]
MREVADVHRDLYTDNRDLYGEDVAIKIERCLAVSQGEANAAARARADYRQAASRALEGFELLVTPTLSAVAPPVGIGDERLREEMIRFTYPFNALGWPALALPCGAAEDGLPASAQIVGRPGTDALVLATGKRLASLL